MLSPRASERWGTPGLCFVPRGPRRGVAEGDRETAETGQLLQAVRAGAVFPSLGSVAR